MAKYLRRFSVIADTTPAEIPIPERWRKSPGARVMYLFNVPGNDVHLVEDADDTEGILIESSAISSIPFGPLPAGWMPRRLYAAGATVVTGTIIRTQ